MNLSHDAYAALRHRNYRLLLTGGVLASIGLEVLAVAVGWELYERTDSAWMLGLVGLAQFLPVLLLALPAGQAADHFSRKLLFQLAQSLLVCAALTLAWLSFAEGPVELILLCLLVIGVGRAFNAPARTALLPQVVPLETLPNAVAWNSTGWQLANMAGPALGGLLVYLAPAWVAYLLAAGCSLICVFLLAGIHIVAAPRAAMSRSLATLLAGLDFVFDTPLLLAAITLDLFAVLLGGAVALLPIFARDILEVGASGLGWLRAAPAFGALTMALVMAHRPPLARPGRTLLFAVAGFGLATIAFGLSRNFYLSFALLALTGALDNISVVVRGTLMQVLTPDAMRGRVSAVNSVFISSSNELGAFESGVTAWAFGPIASVVGGGIGTIIVVLLALWRWPQLARLGPLHQLGKREVPAVEEPPPPVQEPADAAG